MAIFSYTARDIEGVDHTGTVETTDTHQVARILSRKGLVVIKVKKKEDNSKSVINKYLNRVSFNDLVAATRQLATMIESGLVLSEALDILVEQQQNKTFKEVLQEVSRDVKSGLDLATALRKHPEVFPSLYASLVKSGEESGKLDIVLTQMATNLERDREFRAKVKGAMIYPVLVICMMFAVMLIMMLFVVPKLTSLYTQSNIDLPLPTKILIGTSNFFQSFWWLLLLLVIGGFIGLKRWIATPNGKLRFDQFLLKVPVVNKVIEGTSLTNFTRTFGLLITAGIPLLDALNIVSGVIGNSVYSRALKDTTKGVERGLSFSAQLDAVGVFPKLIGQMFKVGEETGKVDKVAFKMAEYYESSIK